MGQGCDPATEYEAFTGGTTVHAVYTNNDGQDVVQCSTVKLGGNGVYN
tara:strand:+ start:1136 stop:1279 length:144 start_codon:yes stop_codon:yes gene_type:complete